MIEHASKPDQEVNATEHPLGKGEVVSSILTGSTRYAHEIRAFDTPRKFRSADRDATKREHDIGIRVKSVESDPPPFAGCRG